MFEGPILSIQDTQVTDPLINQILESRYRIEVEVGRGGMGVVYRGTDLTLSRPVAIKTILHRDADDNALDRFIKEARTLAQIENNRLVPVYAVGQDDGYHYLVMKFLEGETLFYVDKNLCLFKIRRIDSIIFLSSRFYYLSTHRVNSVIFKSR